MQLVLVDNRWDRNPARRSGCVTALAQRRKHVSSVQLVLKGNGMRLLSWWNVHEAEFRSTFACTSFEGCLVVASVLLREHARRVCQFPPKLKALLSSAQSQSGYEAMPLFFKVRRTKAAFSLCVADRLESTAAIEMTEPRKR